MARLIEAESYLESVLNESEVKAVERRLRSLFSIKGCEDQARSMIGDEGLIRAIHGMVEQWTSRAMIEDRPGVCRRRGAGSWRYVQNVCVSLGEIAPTTLEPAGARSQVGHVIADALCDVEIDRLTGKRKSTREGGCVGWIRIDHSR